jgi:ribosomal protein L37AE/L43A
MDENELDILTIDAKIKASFEQERKKLPSYKERLRELQRTIKNRVPVRVRNDLEKSITELVQRIQKLESRSEENFYTADTVEYIERYKTILATPMEVSFIGKPKGNNREKQAVVRAYLTAVQKYYDVNIEQKEKKSKIVCDNCQNRKNFEILDESVYICQECGVQKDAVLHATSYKDIDRVNISTKYSYDRKVHFRDCINQYQGKQNSTIEQKVYDALEDQFQRHHLLIDDPKKEIRFSRIAKEHIAMFLKELGLTKHYENVNLIHYNLTGIRPDDISHLEDKLLADFDALTEMYDKKFKNKIQRTNFINTQYVLYQLLQRHKHSCIKSDFVMLKTVDRQAFHDYVTEVCFRELGWNMIPFY